jgi:hypothetical protein
MSATEPILSEPIGYRIEFRSGRYVYYSLDDFARETQRDGGRIHSLHATPQPGCQQTPVAFRGRYWCESKHRDGNAYLDPDAGAVFLGPELHDPHEAA